MLYTVQGYKTNAKFAAIANIQTLPIIQTKERSSAQGGGISFNTEGSLSTLWKVSPGKLQFLEWNNIEIVIF